MGRWYSQKRRGQSSQFETPLPERESPDVQGPKPAPVQGPKLSPERERFEQIAQSKRESDKLKRLEHDPIVRKGWSEFQKKRIDIKRQELDVSKEKRDIRMRSIKESTPYRSAKFVGKGIQQTGKGIQRFQRHQQLQSYQRQQRQHYQPSPLGIAPGSIGGGRLSTIGLPHYGHVGPSSAISPSPSRLPIHGIGSIRSSGMHVSPSIGPSERIPKGLIKSYWSKKVKTLAKANIKVHGSDEGLERTRQMAAELGWKMQ